MYDSVVIMSYILGDIFAAQHGCKPKDCYDLKCYRVSAGKDGPHTIYPGSADLPNVQVSCDQETDGGGWMIYQRRLDGSVDFERNWTSYKQGFGTIGNDTTEMWMGNENVFQILQAYGSTECELRIEATSFDGDSCWATCYPFQMRPESSKYSMTWNTVEESMSGLGQNLDFHKNLEFSTFDAYSCDRACVTNFKGGWWFKLCASMFFNGVYIPNKQASGTSIFILAFKGITTLQKSCMMFRPRNITRVCNNPCKNDGACEYVAATGGYFCMCTSNFCGAHCDTAKPCKNCTCAYNMTTQTNMWMGGGDHSGPTATHSDLSGPTYTNLWEIAIAATCLIVLVTFLTIGAIILYYKSKTQEEEVAEETERLLLEDEVERESFWLALFRLIVEPVVEWNRDIASNRSLHAR